MDIVDIAHKRYSTKRFTEKAIPADLVEKMKTLLQLSPSSVNSQPWHFLLVETPEGKERLSKAAEGGNSYNKNKILHASHTVVFCVRTDLDDTYMRHLADQEFADGRYASAADRDVMFEKRGGAVGYHKSVNDLDVWTSKQVYLNVGYFLLGVAALGLDAVPVEGIDTRVIDAEFDLAAKGLKSLCIVNVGYRSDDDMNAKLPKSRMPMDTILTTV